MLKRIKKLFSTSSAAPDRIPHSTHGLNRRKVSGSAIRIIEALHAAGHEAYLVGGGVRDLILGGSPKDFDIATNATPEMVQKVFRRAKIIGRRFKIVHVRMGREVFEVTTFRGSHTDAGGRKHAVQSEKGILLRDNVYGDLESDAFRRDFSINALYYDPSTEEIIDYCGGLDDLSARRLSIIGDPSARYKEDPVRMLRAIRFMAKLALKIDPATEAPIKEHSEYLREIPPARLFDETLKLFLSGSAAATIDKLHEYHLLQHLFPSAARGLDGDSTIFQNMLRNSAVNTDKRIRQEKRVTPAFIYASMLWPALQTEMDRLRPDMRCSEQELMFQAANGVIVEQQQKTSIPKRFLIPMRDIWGLQLRLERRDPKRALSLLEHPKFRAGYDFLLLREQSGEVTDSLGDWWTKFQFAEAEEQTQMLSAFKSKSPRRRSRRRKPSDNTDQEPRDAE